MTLRELLSWAALFGASFGLHAVGFAKLNHLGGPAAAKLENKPTFMEMTSASKPPAPPAKAPAAEDKPAPKAARRLAAAAPRPAAAPAARPTPATPPPAETLADFSGTTLTNDGAGAGWASATGNGARMAGPIGRPGARVTGRHVEAATPGVRPAPPAAVPVADLSRRPEAPALDAALERNYPAEARQSGQSGRAVVRARITPEGEVRDLVVQSESGTGFGRACRDTLTGSRWTPPLDRDGRPVATIINYTCRFEVR